MKEVFDITLYGITRCADGLAYTADKLCRKGRMEKRFILLTVDMLSYLIFWTLSPPKLRTRERIRSVSQVAACEVPEVGILS